MGKVSFLSKHGDRSLEKGADQYSNSTPWMQRRSGEDLVICATDRQSNVKRVHFHFFICFQIETAKHFRPALMC